MAMSSIARLLLSALLLVPAALARPEDVLVSRHHDWHQRRSDYGGFEISIYHINDVHAHLDQFSSSGTDCTRPERGCFGGYSRVKTVLNSTRTSKENSLFLNAGDEFQGTLFYNFYRGWRTADALNQLGVDAMTLGNHEFDGGDDELADFINNITFPMLAANLQSTNPTLNSSVKPYVIFEQYGLAVIGVITPETSQLSNPGNGTTFTDPVVAVQAAIDEIKATTDINRIVALTHIGYAEDIKLAEQTAGLSLIIGGHSHTPLGNM
ncbi:5'-nucleotidase [Diaporthe helianthi]|uniref:5'-nucleotidase n=1 Tax=Diaporthe helianthi TaxID=158607 RepID=A0A2P5HHU0_DIAHE|nr:5'-nucleotidase [Diaporthe helianthi]